MLKKIQNLIGMIVLAATPLSVMAYDQPFVNLGYTSFYDGAPPSGTGLYFQDYFQYYNANRFNDAKGHNLPLPKTDLGVTVNITQLLYLSNIEIFGANLGVSALLPWVIESNVNDGLNNRVLRAQSGPGDLFIGPALQFKPIMRKDGKGPLFSHRVEFDVVAPIGRYSNQIAIGPSSHFWSINPYWAMTYWMTPEWSLSARLHYLWNAENNHPNTNFGPVRTSQAGQAFFANFAAGYAWTPKFTLGLNSYVFDQFTDTKVNGKDLPNRREKLWAIGPGGVYSFTKNIFAFVNIYVEEGARNRTQGVNSLLRFVVHGG